MEDITILNNGIDMIKLFSDKEGIKEQGNNFNYNHKNVIINNFTSIDNKILNSNKQLNNNKQLNSNNSNILNNKLSNDVEIQNLTNTPIIYETNRLELTNYSDILL